MSVFSEEGGENVVADHSGAVRVGNDDGVMVGLGLGYATRI